MVLESNSLPDVVTHARTFCPIEPGTIVFIGGISSVRDFYPCVVGQSLERGRLKDCFCVWRGKPSTLACTVEIALAVHRSVLRAFRGSSWRLCARTLQRLLIQNPKVA